jgi:hypothetical protein
MSDLPNRLKKVEEAQDARAKVNGANEEVFAKGWDKFRDTVVTPAFTETHEYYVLQEDYSNKPEVSCLILSDEDICLQVGSNEFRCWRLHFKADPPRRRVSIMTVNPAGRVQKRYSPLAELSRTVVDSEIEEFISMSTRR